MKFKKINKKKLIIIVMSGFIITSLSGCKSEKTEYTTNSTIETNENIETTTNSTIDVNENTYSEKDLIVINELEDLEKQVNQINETSEEKAKAIFITTIDFIFYNKEINGVKFDDLTEEGKQKILEISTNIDIKIENRFPNYKNKISQKATEALNKASELIKEGSTNIGNFTKEKLGEKNYNDLLEAKDELIEFSKKAFEIVGEASKDLYNEGKQKIKVWYESFKNK